ncbi:uncharacterized protein PG986_011600 [Apiospora aurea]|uniref:Uncharacterized protein n=1 Tax=Apiospora aurea TaxID=335848 RepID=A0ABR1PY68_9PEZI
MASKSSKMKQWFKQPYRLPYVALRCKRIVPTTARPADTGNDDDENAEAESDDEATVTSSYFLSVAMDGKVSLPTYIKYSSLPAPQISMQPPPMMVLDVLLQICANFREARLILFEIAPRGTSLLSRRGGLKTSRLHGLKLSGAALKLDKVLCMACRVLKSYQKIGKGSHDATKQKEISQRFANNEQIKDAVVLLTRGPATANRTLRRVEKTVRDGVVETLKTRMIHSRQEIDYDGIRTRAELDKNEAQEACGNLHEVAGSVSSRLR